MPLSVRVVNRQHQFKVDMLQFGSLATLVLGSAVTILKKSRARYVKPAMVQELDLRGVVNIALVSDRQIKTLNRKWRKVNAVTDVLSFPLGLSPPRALPFEVGEIVISVERAVKQARQYNHTVVRELAFLVIHGLLHVLGFDHETKQQELEMFSLQRAILAKAGIDRLGMSGNQKKYRLKEL